MFRWLFDTSAGPPGPGGDWPVWLSAAFHGANLVAGAAMLWSIVVVLRAWEYRRDGVTGWQVFRVSAVIPAVMLCRFVRAASVVGPLNHLAMVADLNAAVWGVYGLFHLRTFVEHVVKLPSRTEVHELNVRLNAANLELVAANGDRADENRALTARLRDVERLLADEEWSAEKAVALDRLRAVLREMPDGT